VNDNYFRVNPIQCRFFPVQILNRCGQKHFIGAYLTAFIFVYPKQIVMQKREEKKQMILNAATECFSQNGYERTTLDDIGNKVSLNKATLYYYYNSKDDLFCDVIYSEAYRFRELVRIGVNQKSGLENKISFLLYERAKFYQQLRQLHDIIVEQGRKIEPIFISLRESIYKEESILLINILKESMEAGEIRYSDAGRLADVFLKISDSNYYHSQIGQSENKLVSGVQQDSILDDIRFTTRLIVSGMSARF
jgi:AcrR family transcriptional regulator